MCLPPRQLKAEQLRNEGNLSGLLLHHHVCEVRRGAPPLSLAALRGFIELLGAPRFDLCLSPASAFQICRE